MFYGFFCASWQVQIDPYIEDSVCSACAVQHGAYFCREPVRIFIPSIILELIYQLYKYFAKNESHSFFSQWKMQQDFRRGYDWEIFFFSFPQICSRYFCFSCWLWQHASEPMSHHQPMSRGWKTNANVPLGYHQRTNFGNRSIGPPV